MRAALAVALSLALASGAGAQRAPEPFEAPSGWGYRDAAGRVVVPPRFRSAEPFRGAMALATDSLGLAYIDRAGRVLVRPFVYDAGPDYFQQGVARFVEGGRIGFFDGRGRKVIPARFTFAQPFSGGRAAFCEGCRWTEQGEHRVVDGGRWGFIDRAGRVVVPARFARAERFEGGRARVLLDGRWRFIDPAGRVLGPAREPHEDA